MKENSILNPARFYLLTRKDIWMSLSRIRVSGQMVQNKTIGLIMIVVLAVAGMHYWASISSVESASEELFRFSHGMSQVTLLLLGGFLASVAFKELHESEESCTWLALPGSLLEKYVSRLLLTSLGYIVAAAIAYVLFVTVLIGLSRLVFGHIVIPFNPFDKALLDGIAYYLVLHSLFMLGGIIFKELAYPKTAIVLSVVFAACAKTLHFYMTTHGIAYHTDPQMDTIWMVIRIAFWGIMAPVVWVIGYYLLRRKEA